MTSAGSGDDAQAKDAADMAWTIIQTYTEHAEPSRQPFQRKLSTQGRESPWLTKLFQVGSEIDLPLTSWANDPGVGDGDVWLHVPVGTTTLDIGKLGGIIGETETLTGGRFKVVHVSETEGVKHVYLKQLRPYAPPRNEHGKPSGDGRALTEEELKQYLDYLQTNFGPTAQACAPVYGEMLVYYLTIENLELAPDPQPLQLTDKEIPTWPDQRERRPGSDA